MPLLSIRHVLPLQGFACSYTPDGNIADAFFSIRIYLPEQLPAAYCLQLCCIYKTTGSTCQYSVPKQHLYTACCPRYRRVFIEEAVPGLCQQALPMHSMPERHIARPAARYYYRITKNRNLLPGEAELLYTAAIELQFFTCQKKGI